MLAPSFSVKPTLHVQARQSLSNRPRFGGEALDALHKEKADLEDKRVQETAHILLKQEYQNVKNGRTLTVVKFLKVFEELRLQGTTINAADDETKLRHAYDAAERARQIEMGKKNKSLWQSLVGGRSQPEKGNADKSVLGHFPSEDHELVWAAQRALIRRGILQFEEVQGIKKLTFTHEGKKVWDAMKALNKPSSSNTSIDLLS